MVESTVSIILLAMLVLASPFGSAQSDLANGCYYSDRSSSQSTRFVKSEQCTFIAIENGQSNDTVIVLVKAWVSRHLPVGWKMKELTLINAADSEQWCSLKVERSSSAPLKQRMKFNVVRKPCKGEGTQEVIWVKLQAEKSVLRAKADLAAYSELTSELVTIEEVNAFKREFKNAVGQLDESARVTQKVVKGQLINERIIAQKKTVSAGDKVTVILSGSAFQINRTGLALNSAEVGEVVKVALENQSEFLQATVKEEGIAIYE